MLISRVYDNLVTTENVDYTKPSCFIRYLWRDKHTKTTVYGPNYINMRRSQQQKTFMLHPLPSPSLTFPFVLLGLNRSISGRNRMFYVRTLGYISVTLFVLFLFPKMILGEMKLYYIHIYFHGIKVLPMACITDRGKLNQHWDEVSDPFY